MGGSHFKGAVGSMMIEVMPFLHIMCGTIESIMSGSSKHDIVATIMVAYACSTILTGIVFILIGVFKLGNVVQFFPRHILIGCIGGIGFFLLLTGVEVTAKIEPILNFEYLKKLFEPKALMLWGSSFLVSCILKILQHFIFHPLLVPCFYASVPIIFYAIVLISGISMDSLRAGGWLFNFDQSVSVPFYVYWTYFDFNSINWSAVSGISILISYYSYSACFDFFWNIARSH
jgi:SulP family sulfate permease